MASAKEVAVFSWPLAVRWHPSRRSLSSSRASVFAPRWTPSRFRIASWPSAVGLSFVQPDPHFVAMAMKVGARTPLSCSVSTSESNDAAYPYLQVRPGVRAELRIACRRCDVML